MRIFTLPCCGILPSSSGRQPSCCVLNTWLCPMVSGELGRDFLIRIDGSLTLDVLPRFSSNCLNSRQPNRTMSLLRPSHASRAGIGHAQMGIERGTIGDQRCAVGGMDHAAALENDGGVGDTENLLGR